MDEYYRCNGRDLFTLCHRNYYVLPEQCWLYPYCDYGEFSTGGGFCESIARGHIRGGKRLHRSNCDSERCYRCRYLEQQQHSCGDYRIFVRHIYRAYSGNFNNNLYSSGNRMYRDCHFNDKSSAAYTSRFPVADKPLPRQPSAAGECIR